MSDVKSDILRPGDVIRPKVDPGMAKILVERLYGLKVKLINELNSYDDKNFHIVCEDEKECENPWIVKPDAEGYVLKITNSLDSRKTDFIEGQTALLNYLAENRIAAPLPVKNLKGGFYSLENFDEGDKKEQDTNHVVRLLTYKTGSLILNVESSDELLFDVGQFVAKLDNVLKDFDHPAYENHSNIWMLNSVPMLRDFLYVIEDPERRGMVNDVIDKFEKRVIEGFGNELEKGMIHGDLNEQNILVDGEEGRKVVAVLDVGDSQKSCLVFELAIALCYMLLRAGDIGKGKYLINGYNNLRSIPITEKNILKLCVCARLCQSLVLGAYSHRNDPNNDYLLGTQKPGWKLFEKLWPIDDHEIENIWFGFQSCDNHTSIN